MAEDEAIVKRRVEIFSAGCRTCVRTIEQLHEAIDPRHEIVVHELHRSDAAVERADSFGIRALPAVAVDGQLLGCCRNSGPRLSDLRAAGVARPGELRLRD